MLSLKISQSSFAIIIHSGYIFSFSKVVTFEEMISTGEGIEHLRKPVFCTIHIVESIKFFCNSCLVSIINLTKWVSRCSNKSWESQTFVFVYFKRPENQICVVQKKKKVHFQRICMWRWIFSNLHFHHIYCHIKYQLPKFWGYSHPEAINNLWYTFLPLGIN